MNMFLKALGSIAFALFVVVGYAQQTTGVLRTPQMGERDELLKLYDSLGGKEKNLWKNRWDISKPISEWYGVKVGSKGVTCIDLDGIVNCGFNPTNTGNGLKGRVPILDLPYLDTLSLSGNHGITGPLPNLSKLFAIKFLYVADCMLDQFEQDPFEDLQELVFISLQRNQFQGILPPSLGFKRNLQSLQVQGNQLRGKIPISSNLKVLDISDNYYTFRDIIEVWNRKKVEIRDNNRFFFIYKEQKAIPMPDIIRAPIGFPLVLDVKVDSGEMGTTFKWYKNDLAKDSLKANSQLKFKAIKAEDAGTYKCTIRHDSLPDLVLKSEPVQLQVCAPRVYSITGPRCPDYSEKIGQVTIDVFHPNDTIVVADANAGKDCDSIVVANVTFIFTQKIQKTICPGQSFTIGGKRLNSTGMHQIYVSKLGARCKDSLYLVDLKVEELPQANAEQDVTLCEPVLNLQGNTPPGTQGEWQDDSGMPLGNNVTVNNLQPGLNRFDWVLSTDKCPAYSRDELRVYYEARPSLKADTTFEITEGTSKVFNPIDKDIIMNRAWNLSWINPPQVGQFQPNPDGTFRYTADLGRPQTLNFGYRICSRDCPNNCSTTQIRLKIEPEKNPTGCHNVITPNRDGYNDTLIIPLLEGKAKEEYKQNEFIVVNAQNQVVFRMAPYNNTWGGQNQKNEMLPLGTYYYKFMASGLKEPISCSVVITK